MLVSNPRDERTASPSPPRRGPGITEAVPHRWVGWSAIVLSALGLGPWVVLPLITTVFGEAYPVTDSFVMPVIGTVLIDAAAILNVLCVWLWRQRSVLNIIALGLTVPLALFSTFFVVGEGLGGG